MARIPGLIRRSDGHYAIRLRVPDAIRPVIATMKSGNRSERPTHPKLSVVIADFKNGKRESKESDDKTQGIQGGRLQTCLEPLTDKRIGDITPDDMEKFRADIQKVPASFRSRLTKGTPRQAMAKAKTDARLLSTTTANLHLGVIKSVFIYAKKGIDR